MTRLGERLGILASSLSFKKTILYFRWSIHEGLRPLSMALGRVGSTKTTTGLRKNQSKMAAATKRLNVIGKTIATAFFFMT